MKLKEHSVAFALRNRVMHRGLDDEQPADLRRQPAIDEVRPVSIIDRNLTGESPEVGPDVLEYQQNDTEEKPKDTLRFYLLGVATILYLLALIFILLG